MQEPREEEQGLLDRLFHRRGLHTTNHRFQEMWSLMENIACDSSILLQFSCDQSLTTNSSTFDQSQIDQAVFQYLACVCLTLTLHAITQGWNRQPP